MSLAINILCDADSETDDYENMFSSRKVTQIKHLVLLCPRLAFEITCIKFS